MLDLAERKMLRYWDNVRPPLSKKTSADKQEVCQTNKKKHPMNFKNTVEYNHYI